MCQKADDLEFALKKIVVDVEWSPFVVQVVLTSRQGLRVSVRRTWRGELTLILRPNFMADDRRGRAKRRTGWEDYEGRALREMRPRPPTERRERRRKGRSIWVVS